jgi:CHAT domain-containing protein/tetratricopeptide (TPR) repeat protein
MSLQNKWRPALEPRRKRYADHALVSLLALLLFFSLVTAIPSRQVFGGPFGLFPQATQQSRDTGNGASDEKDVRPLEVGKPIRRELAGGQRHAYRVALNANQFLKVIVEQQGIDLVTQVSGPDGKQIMGFDSESRPQGREEVSLVAEVAGAFQLIVSSTQNGAPAGSYEIRVEELRVATDTDRALHGASKQIEEALQLQREGKYDEALPLVERGFEIRERLLGPEHLDVTAAIDSLAGIHTDKGEYVKAEPLYKRALAIREKALGNDHPLIAATLDNLAELYRAQGKYGQAESFIKRALEIREEALGKDHSETASSLNNLAVLYASQGKHGQAEPLHKRALEIREKALGKEHPNTANSLNTLAFLYKTQGKYAEAEPLYRRALEIREKALGKDHPSTAISLNNLAQLYIAKGKFREAEPFQKRSLEIREKTLGNDHPLTAAGINNLALLYFMQAKYAEAEPLYKRALEIREKTLGKDHPLTAQSLNNLAALYREQGKYAEVEPLYKSALEIREKRLGNDHPSTAQSLDNLAMLYRWQGKYEEAEALHKRALEIREKRLGNDHPDIANSLSNLAVLYESQGKYGQAEPLHKRALEIREKRLGKEHPLTANSLSNLAVLYATQGKYGEAEPLFKRALDIEEKALDNDHPDTVVTLNNLAVLYTATGDLVQAVKLQSRASTASERNLARNLVIGSERQKLAYLATLSTQTDRNISLHLHSVPDDSAAGALAATMILQRKGRALDATSQNLNVLRSRFNAEDQALLDQLTEARSQIARLVLSGPQEMTAEQHRDQIKTLEDQAEKDAADISRRSDEFRTQFLPVTLEAVRAAIPPDSALIEFASYRPFNAKATKDDEAYGQPRYAAYVLRHEGEIKWKELGEAKSIDTAIAAFRKALRDPKRVDVRRLARAVDAKVFQPLRQLLGGMTRLLISPDGPLNLVPFTALVDEKGRYAVERYSISYLTSGRDLLRLQVARESKGGPLVVAAPDFGRRSPVEASRLGEQEKDTSEGSAKSESAQSIIKDFYFPPLPHAEREGAALRALLPDATLLTKSQATKVALGQVRSPELLHIATHSFFLEDQQLTLPGERGASALTDDPERTLQQLERRGVSIESPLLRSGLALAGANEHKDDDNGILTALEVTGLNLWGTKLVTLSACDTGVGEVKNGDGVHGLRRALVLAGSETQVMSLWAVSDKATRELMVSYYRMLQQGQGRGEALRLVQLEMLKKMKWRHPYYWAGFIQSGEWANLDGKR